MGLGEPSIAEQLKVPLHHLVYGWSIDPRVGANRGPDVSKRGTNVMEAWEWQTMSRICACRGA